MGQGIVDQHWNISLCLYSTDFKSRTEGTLWVNGVLHTFYHSRYAVEPGGRHRLPITNRRWSRPDLSCFWSPGDTLQDGVNVFELELQGDLEIHAAYVTSRPNYSS